MRRLHSTTTRRTRHGTRRPGCVDVALHLELIRIRLRDHEVDDVSGNAIVGKLDQHTAVQRESRIHLVERRLEGFRLHLRARLDDVLDTEWSRRCRRSRRGLIARAAIAAQPHVGIAVDDGCLRLDPLTFGEKRDPGDAAFRLVRAVELDAREEPLAIPRPVVGCRACAVLVRQRLRRAVCDDGLLEHVLAVHSGGDGDAGSSRWPHAHRGAGGNRNRESVLVLDDRPAPQVRGPARVEGVR